MMLTRLVIDSLKCFQGEAPDVPGLVLINDVPFRLKEFESVELFLFLERTESKITSKVTYKTFASNCILLR